MFVYYETWEQIWDAEDPNRFRYPARYPRLRILWDLLRAIRRDAYNLIQKRLGHDR
jgi:hypothetical protein